MRFFDIFKKKDKKDTDIENSLNDYFHKLEKYKKLSKGEVGSIPDVDLKTAVMSWIRGKFNEDWTNQYEVIESLPKPCRHVYACCTVIDEVSNGGLNQLFFNSTGQFAHGIQTLFQSHRDIDNNRSIIILDWQ